MPRTAAPALEWTRTCGVSELLCSDVRLEGPRCGRVGLGLFLCLYSSKETESGTRRQQCRGAVCVKEGRRGSARASLCTVLTSKGKNKLLSDGGRPGEHTRSPGTRQMEARGSGIQPFSATQWTEESLGYVRLSHSPQQEQASAVLEIPVSNRDAYGETKWEGLKSS